MGKKKDKAAMISEPAEEKSGEQNTRKNSRDCGYATCAMVDRPVERQEASAHQRYFEHSELNPYEPVAFEEPKLGKRQKRPDDFVDDETRRTLVPDVF